MKRLLLAFAIAGASLVTLNSCTKEYITNNFVPSQTMIYERVFGDWKRESSNRLYVELSVKELNAYYMDQGIVTLAMSQDGEKSYDAIPATIDGISYSFNYKLGIVRVYLEDPIMDNGVTINPPDKVFFKVSLTDADWVE
ncbi:hypothetical protein [Sphingobacterium paucimobilis]|uniref:Lipocalin-like domain-containing protein n=1 Tax=Sphingobacterium paucimobilis HER1398 TaxID=1346330 RepID=U2HGB1_9SPHI|nr:hypothetical protein [Sphingobacterium paucimobilis]ERJ60796.1 hypothetical protein M472_18750 [Sphingobacterium paucimobilis HER1398]